MLVNGKTNLHLRLSVCFSYTSYYPIDYLISVRDYDNIKKIKKEYDTGRCRSLSYQGPYPCNSGDTKLKLTTGLVIDLWHLQNVYFKLE